MGFFLTRLTSRWKGIYMIRAIMTYYAVLAAVAIVNALDRS